jgi:hypothetical protein
VTLEYFAYPLVPLLNIISNPPATAGVKYINVDISSSSGGVSENLLTRFFVLVSNKTSFIEVA